MQVFSEKNKKQLLCVSLGKVLTKLRQEAGLSARAVSYSIDISKTTLLLAEAGKLDPQISTFYRLAEAYNMKPSQLLSMIEDELPDSWFLSD